MQLDEALTSRDSININLRQILDDATDKWGVRVVRVEIQRIDPPPDVMNSMHEQMKAERTRRAVVTEAEGRRTAAITTRRGRAAGGGPRRRGPEAAADPPGRGRGASRSKPWPTPSATASRRSPQGEADAIRLVYTAIHDGDPDGGPRRHQVPRDAAGDGQRPGHQDHPAHRAGRRSPARIAGITETISLNGAGEPPATEDVIGTMKELPAHEAVNQYFAQAATILDLDAEMHAVLTTPYREISVQVPVRLDDGDLIVARGLPGAAQRRPRARTRAASATTPPPTSTRSGPWRR